MYRWRVWYRFGRCKQYRIFYGFSMDQVVSKAVRLGLRGIFKVEKMYL